MSVQLNAFQRMMYHWSELHPYNATHTCNIAGPLDAEKLLDAIRETYLLNGIGLTHIHPDGLTFRHEADSSPEVQVLSGGKDADGCLTDFTTRELNGPFERPTFRPMRFSVIDAGPQNHFVSLTYDHWIGDGMAARLVLRHVLGRYCDLPIPENNEPLDLYPARYRTIFGNRLRGLKLGLATVRMLRHWNRNRKAWQVRFDALERERDQLAAELGELYPKVESQLVSVFARCANLDARLSALHQSRPSGCKGTLLSAELVARNLTEFSRDQFSLTRELKIPSFTESSRLSWPPRETPAAVLLAESIASQGDPRRHSGEWYKVLAEDTERRKSEEAKRLAEEQRRTAAAKLDYEKSLPR